MQQLVNHNYRKPVVVRNRSLKNRESSIQVQKKKTDFSKLGHARFTWGKKQACVKNKTEAKERGFFFQIRKQVPPIPLGGGVLHV